LGCGRSSSGSFAEKKKKLVCARTQLAKKKEATGEISMSEGGKGERDRLGVEGRAKVPEKEKKKQSRQNSTGSEDEKARQRKIPARRIKN